MDHYADVNATQAEAQGMISGTIGVVAFLSLTRDLPSGPSRFSKLVLSL
jgi:hypothetical protein